MGVMLGPFELVEPAAKGGMAEVWRGLHRERDVPVAIKIIMGDFATDPAYHARFADEVRAVAALDHPGVVTVLDHGKVDAAASRSSEGALRAGTPWLAMEYCSRGTVSQLEFPLRWNQVRATLLATLDALAHAHARGVIHRDLKPPNLLRAGPHDLRPGLKLSDFGISWIGQDESGTPMGTPRYMAPEQIQMHWRDYGPWTDLYSLGCMAWWLVAGKTPFHARRVPDTLIGQLHREPPFFDAQLAVPEDYEAWLRVLLQKRPQDRYQRAADAAEALLKMGPPVDPDLEEPDEAAVSSTMVALSGNWAEPPDSIGGTGPRPAPAKIPLDWRHRRVAPAPPALVGAGLSLFGLRTLPVAGRTAERDLLWRQLHAVHRTGKAHAVLISGAAGTGKSRLAEWLCQRAHEVGAAGIGRAVFSPELAPGQALQRMGRDYFGVHGLDREDVAARVEEWMAPLGSSPEERMVLTEILQPATDEDLASGAPSVRLTSPRDYLAAIAATFRTLSSERPMIAWLDDVQWGVHGLGLALQMLEQADIPVLLVLTLRTEALPEDGPEARRVARLVAHPDCEEIALQPLSSAEHRALVSDLMGSLDRKLAARLLERTAGNPLFAVQLLGSWVRRGILVPSEGGLVLARGADAALPDDMNQIWREQIDREVASFGPSAAHYLEIAAVLGQTVERTEWRAACDDPEGFFGDRFPGDESLRAALVERLLTVRLAVGTVARWSFVHGMLRESLEQRARESGRLQQHHLSCAQMLGRRAHLPEVQERLGRHLLAAGLSDRAVEPLLRGVSVRRLTVGPEPALALLALAEEAIAEAGLPASDPRHGQLDVLKARIAADAGETAEAEAVVGRALVAASTHGWEQVRIEATTVRTELRLAARQHTAAEIDLAALLEMARDADHEIRAGTAHIGLAEVARSRGDFVRATELLGQALHSLERAGEAPERRVEEARAWRLLGRCAEAAGDPDEARSRYEGARERYDRLGYALGSADCLDRLGRIAAEADDLAAAVEHLGAALSRYDALGSDRRFSCRLRLGLAHARAGSPEEAWDAVAGVQQVGAHLDRGGNVALGHALRLVRASVDQDWGAWANAFGQTASTLPRKGMAPGLVAWLGHIAGVLTAPAQPRLAAQALRASSAIWAAAGEIGRSAEIAATMETLDVD